MCLVQEPKGSWLSQYMLLCFLALQTQNYSSPGESQQFCICMSVPGF